MIEDAMKISFDQPMFLNKKDFIKWKRNHFLEYASIEHKGRRLTFLYFLTGRYIVKHGDLVVYNNRSMDDAIEVFNDCQTL